MVTMTPREKRKMYMEQKGYNKLSSEEREAKLRDALQFLQHQVGKLTPEAQELFSRREANDGNNG